MTDCDTPETYPYPEDLIELSDEAAYRDTLRDVFRRFGWDAESEVTSDCGTCRADLVVRHPKWGVVGIECKYGDDTRPSMWANALKQVQRYSDVEFNSEKISQWAVSVEGRKGRDEDLFDRRQQTKSSGHREFINVMGYGVLQIHTTVELIFNYSTPMVKFPVAKIDYPSGELLPPSLQRLQECDTPEARQYEC